MRHQHFSSSGYTGHLFEDEVLGTCRLKWNGGYLPFREAVWQVRQSQPWSPKAPTLPVPKTLLAAVRRKMCSEDVEFYTAVGSALDLYHGVDGYFFFRGLMVTIDASLREKEEPKADLVLTQACLENLGYFAERVVEVYKLKHSGRGWTRDYAAWKGAQK